MQSDGHEKSPSAQKQHSSLSAATGSTLQQYPVRRMRNTAVLVKWIEEHQANPYPTKAEKQYLAYYSGMNLTQLSTWFANARRRIKKIGMKTWLEGRSTFTVDFYPANASAFTPSRANMSADYLNGSGYNTSLTANPYAAMGYSSLHSSYPSNQSSTLGLGAAAAATTHRLSYSTEIPAHSSSSSTLNYGGLYSATSRSAISNPIGLSALSNWSSAAASAPPLLPNISQSVSTMQTRPSSNTGPTLHSPLTAQVYSADPTALRTHATLDMSEPGPYSLPQRSPADQMLPECASTEPIPLQGSPKSRYTGHAD